MGEGWERGGRERQEDATKASSVQAPIHTHTPYYAITSLVCPIRCARSCACKSIMGFQSESKMITCRSMDNRSGEGVKDTRRVEWEGGGAGAAAAGG